MTVFRTEPYTEAVWIRDSDGGEHRIALTELPPGPYHQCGDCHCGKRKPKGDAANGHDGESPRGSDDAPGPGGP